MIYHCGFVLEYAISNVQAVASSRGRSV